MKRTNLILTALLLIVVIGCSKLDNYSAPNAGVSGTVIDNTTNAGIQTEAGSGFQIGLIESGYSSVIPINFYAKADGSFENTQLFADKYKVIPFNGAFLQPDTVTVDVKGLTTVNFTVTPFMSVNASTPQLSGKNIIVNYTLSKPSKIGYDIIDCMTMAASVPSVCASVNDYNVSHSLSGSTYQQIAAMQFSDTLKSMSSGTYYVRVAGLTNNSQNKYNYSKVYTVTVP
jgi:hypothetical protein